MGNVGSSILTSTARGEGVAPEKMPPLSQTHKTYTWYVLLGLRDNVLLIDHRLSADLAE